MFTFWGFKSISGNSGLKAAFKGLVSTVFSEQERKVFLISKLLEGFLGNLKGTFEEKDLPESFCYFLDGLFPKKIFIVDFFMLGDTKSYYLSST